MKRRAEQRLRDAAENYRMALNESASGNSEKAAKAYIKRMKEDGNPTYYLMQRSLEKQLEDKNKEAIRWFNFAKSIGADPYDYMIYESIRAAFALRDASAKDRAKYTLGVTRLCFEHPTILADSDEMKLVTRVLKMISTGIHREEYNSNLAYIKGLSPKDMEKMDGGGPKGMSFEEIEYRFGERVKADDDEQRALVAKMTFHGNNGYRVIRIDDRKDLIKLAEKPVTEWCIAQPEGDDQWKGYHFDLNQGYLCIKEGYKFVPKKGSSKSPDDDYGRSMIMVSVDAHGNLATCTNRWNHEYYANDDQYTPVELSEMLDMDFYKTFKPNDKVGRLSRQLMSRLGNGEAPKDVFDDVEKLYGGYSIVRYDVDRESDYDSRHRVKSLISNILDDVGHPVLDEWVAGDIIRVKSSKEEDRLVVRGCKQYLTDTYGNRMSRDYRGISSVEAKSSPMFFGMAPLVELPGRMPILMATTGSKMALMDFGGNIVSSWHVGISLLHDDCYDPIVVADGSKGGGNLYYIADGSGNVISEGYKHMEAGNDGMAIIATRPDGKEVAIGKDGKVICDDCGDRVYYICGAPFVKKDGLLAFLKPDGGYSGWYKNANSDLGNIELTSREGKVALAKIRNGDLSVLSEWYDGMENTRYSSRYDSIFIVNDGSMRAAMDANGDMVTDWYPGLVSHGDFYVADVGKDSSIAVRVGDGWAADVMSKIVIGPDGERIGRDVYLSIERGDGKSLAAGVAAVEFDCFMGRTALHRYWDLGRPVALLDSSGRRTTDFWVYPNTPYEREWEGIVTGKACRSDIPGRENYMWVGYFQADGKELARYQMARNDGPEIGLLRKRGCIVCRDERGVFLIQERKGGRLPYVDTARYRWIDYDYLNDICKACTQDGKRGAIDTRTFEFTPDDDR